MQIRDWLFPKKPKRLLILVSILVVLLAGERFYRSWRPSVEISTGHYTLYSTATPEETREIGRAVEALYTAYREVFAGLPEIGQEHPTLKLKLFKDRKEFRRCNRGVGWAEAFYRQPYCHAYYSADEINSVQWMVHEAVHQLNREVAHFTLAQWADEGLAEYFSTSVFAQGAFHPGQLDRNTYPLWWVGDMTLTGDLAKDLASRQIIPLRAIVTGQGGPNLNEQFNLYYIHWWSLAHFLFHHEDGKYRQAFFQVIRDGGSLESFEQHVGPIERIQGEWYGDLQRVQQSLSSTAPIRDADLRARRRTSPPEPNGPGGLPAENAGPK